MIRFAGCIRKNRCADMKTVKFGGTSLADADRIRHAADIVRSDSERKYVVVSAPGKRSNDDEKITDLLYQLFRKKQNHEDTDKVLNTIRQRYETIAQSLKVSGCLDGEFEDI